MMWLNFYCSHDYYAILLINNWLAKCILMQMYSRSKSHSEKHTHTLPHSIIKKASSIISTTKSISLRQTLLRPTTQPPQSFDLWSNVEFLVLKPSSRHFSLVLFYFYLLSILSSFVWWYFDDTDNRFSNPSLQFAFRERKEWGRSKKWQIDEWRCIKF